MTPLLQISPSISVIVPARNEEAAIGACVESLIRQEEIAEIAVVNDQSTDKTAEIVRDLAAKYPGVKVIDVAELPRAGWARIMPYGSARTRRRAIGCCSQTQIRCTRNMRPHGPWKLLWSGVPRWSRFRRSKSCSHGMRRR